MKVPFPNRGNFYDKDDINAVLSMLDVASSDKKWEIIHQFEDDFASYIGAKHALSVSNATAALHLSLKAIGLKPGDEVITTPMTWAATSNVILLEKAKPVFVDVEPDTLNIDPSKIEEKITEKTKAIIPVHLYGHPVDLGPIMKIAEEHNLKVIGDAAHAPGAEYKNKKIGSIEHMAAFSFYTQKNMSTLGEGGMVVTDNSDFFEKLKLYQNHGVEYLKSIKEKPWFRNCIVPGYNYRLSEGQAAVGITQLKKLDSFNKKRRELAKIYSELLGKVEGITMPIEKDYAKSSWHIYSIKIEKDFGVSRDEVCLNLNKLGVGSNVHYTPVHYFLPYQKLGYKKGDFPVAEEAYEKIISIPLSVNMEREQVEYVVECLREIRK